MGLWTILIKRFFPSSLSLARPYSIIHYSVSSSLFWTVIIPLYNTIRVDYEHYSTNANIALWIMAISIFTFGLNFKKLQRVLIIASDYLWNLRKSKRLRTSSDPELPSFIQPFSSQYLTSYSSTIGVNIHYATRRNLIHVDPFYNNSPIFLIQLLRNSMEFPSLHPMTKFQFVN